MKEIRSRIDKPDIVITSANGINFGLHSPLLRTRWQYYSQNPKDAIDLLSKLSASCILEVIQYLYACLLPKEDFLPLFKELKIFIPEHHPIDKYRTDMKSLYSNHLLCDFIIKFGKTEFPVHRFILAASSTFFANLFSSGFAEDNSGVFEDDIAEKAKNINDFLEYLYTGVADISSYEDCFTFLKVCKYYQIIQEKNETELFISKLIIKKYFHQVRDAITKAKQLRFFVLADILEACQI